MERPHVVFQQRDPSIDLALSAVGQARKIGAIAQNFMSMPMVASRTGFICNLPGRIARSFADSYELSVHEPPVNIPPWPLYVVWHSRVNGDPAIAWIISKLRDAVETIR